MFDIIKKLFGTPSQRALKKIQPYLAQIHAAQDQLKPLSDQALRQATTDLKAQLTAGLQPLQTTLDDLKARAEQTHDFKTKLNLYAQIDRTQAQYDTQEDQLLIDILPTAFAIMRETAHRFATQPHLRVPITPHDQAIAAQHPHVTLQDGHAHWHNTWEAGGEQIQWNMVHYDVQLLGGIVLHQGKVAEMKTGEGKTLAATLPIYLNALTGRGVHVITVNDYLAKRDAAWMGPLYQFHQLTVDCADQHPPFTPQRKQAYAADITYCTGNATGFDYLRDNMATTLDEKMQRGYNYAIVDEVDSVLIDEARTPLIISGPADYTGHQEYYTLKPLIQQLYNAQYKLITTLLQEAQTKITQDDPNTKAEGGLALFRIYRGLPKYKPFIHLLSQKGVKQLLSTTEDHYLQENARLMPEADDILFFTIDEKLNHINLTDKGLDYLAHKTQQPDFFILPDIATQIATLEQDPNLTDDEKLQRKNTLTQDYSTKAARLHAVNQLLKAYATFEKEVDYIVLNQKVKIVDEKTGRILEGRRYSDGLHQALEAKENVTIEPPTQTYATITPQNQFRMYRKLAGMTGTAETESAEFWEIYKLHVVVIPTHKPIIRQDHDDLVFKTKAEKDHAIQAKVHQLTQAQRPVLVITTSVESSEHTRKILGLKKNKVLNAKNHALESKIIAKAGQASEVTVVTQMGGRGTDIKPTPQAKQAGGLFVLITEKNTNQRIDIQARGRSGRQGDPGDTQAFVSLEDNLIAHFRHGFIGKQMDKAFTQEGEAIQDPMITNALTTAQQRIEEQHFFSRKRSLEYDDVMNMQRVVIYGKRDNALLRNRLTLDIMSMFYNTLHTIAQEAHDRQSIQHLHLSLKSTLGTTLKLNNHNLLQQPLPQLVDTLYQQAIAHYQTQQQAFMQQFIDTIAKIPAEANVQYIELPTQHQQERITAAVDLPTALQTQGRTALQAIESAVILHFLDEHWKRHLLQMDHLRETTRNVVYEQKDPLLIYKFEALELFKQLMRNINQSIVTYLTQWKPPAQGHPTPHQRPRKTNPLQGMQETKEDLFLGNIPDTPTQPIRTEKAPNRNQRITVRYTNGQVKKDIKYKTVAADLEKGLCTIIDP